MLAAISPADKAPELFGWLRGLPFVSQRAGSWAYHEVVRSAMLRLRRAEAPVEWRAGHLALAESNAQWGSAAAELTGISWANPEWVDYAREGIYHLLCADPTGNLPRALRSAVRAAESGVIRARQWAGIFADAGRDADNAVLRQWGQRLRDGIQDSDVTQYLTCLVNEAHLDNAILGIALAERGINHKLAGRNSQALADFSRAIELDPGYAWAIAQRGEACRELGRFEEAIADLSHAIELNPAVALTIILYPEPPESGTERSTPPDPTAPASETS